MTQIPDANGELTEENRSKLAAAGANAIRHAQRAYARLSAATAWPAEPSAVFRNSVALDEMRVSTGIGNRGFGALWEAIVFDRDGYICEYCGRDAFAFFDGSGQRRTLRLVIDHRTPVGKDRGTYDITNCVTACWTCNHMKGAFPENVFRQELDSIIEARAAMRPADRAPNPAVRLTKRG